MTGLTRTVKRGVPGGRRGFVVAIHPGKDPMIEVREKYRREGFSITVASLYTILAWREADRVAREKRAKHKVGRER